MMLIKVNCIFIDGVGDDRADTRDFRHLKASSDAVGQQISPESFAMVVSIDGQPTDEQQRHLIGHGPPEPGRGQRNALFHGCRYRVIANDTSRGVAWTHDIGTGGQPFARKRPII
jgi:hypothetical protein